METEIFDSLKDAIKNWWVSLILGILFVGMGIWMIFDPRDTYVALVMVFSVLWFVTGIMEIVFAATNRNTLNGWGWTLTAGIIDLLFGLFFMIFPGITMVLIPFIFAFWFMFKGISAIGFSIELQRLKVSGWGYLLTIGILVTLLAIILLFVPLAAAYTFAYVAAFAFFMIGIYRIMLSFELNRINRKINGVKKRK